MPTQHTKTDKPPALAEALRRIAELERQVHALSNALAAQSVGDAKSQPKKSRAMSDAGRDLRRRAIHDVVIADESKL